MNVPKVKVYETDSTKRRSLYVCSTEVDAVEQFESVFVRRNIISTDCSDSKWTHLIDFIRNFSSIIAFSFD